MDTFVFVVCLLVITGFGVWNLIEDVKATKRKEKRFERFMTAIEEIAKSK